MLKSRFFRFLVIGAVNTIFSYAVYAALLFAGLDYVYAYLLALIIGVVVSFKTQGAFVFGNREKSLFGRFVLCWILIYIANIFFIKEMMQLGFDAYVAGAMAIPLSAVASYFVLKLFVFRIPKPMDSRVRGNDGT